MSVRHLTAQDRAAIEALATVCRQHEFGLDLPLYLPTGPATGEFDVFVHYHDDAPIGVATLTQHEQVEVMGMVHPAHRRRGIGRALLYAVRQACRHRGALGFLLVCEEAAPSGKAFADAVGGAYHFAEHRMELNRATLVQRQRPSLQGSLVIEPAGMQDVDTLVALWMACNNITEAEARRETLGQLERANEILYIGRLRDDPVGMLRVQMFETSVFIVSFRVHPAHRQRGYARQILVDVIDRLVADDREHVMLEVATDNEVALSLYRSCGFEKVATYLYYSLSV